MKLKYKVLEECEKAKEASLKLAFAAKDGALKSIVKALAKNKKKILAANKKDAKLAKGKISNALYKRLLVDDQKIKEMVDMVKSVIKLADPVGKVLKITELDKGLVLYKVSAPIGVIGTIFESRPDVVVQISSLAIKSGNAVLLKGGSEAINTNKALVAIIRDAIKKFVPIDSVQLLETREEVKEMLGMDEFIDLIIPRGSNKFVKYVQDNTKIAVLGHSDGICHVYVDKDANIAKAVKICIDAKCQYAAVCNAMETLLVDKRIINGVLLRLVKKYLDNGVELRLDNISYQYLKKSIKNKKIKINNIKKIKKAGEKDWGTEYNELILSIKVVKDIDEAIKHINKYGSGHTDAIITENKINAFKFMDMVDSSSVIWNASTRFSDGYRYGFGAEVGISTNKIHARGPVGLEGLTIYKYRLIGNSHIVADYSGKNAKQFSHRRLK